MNLKINDRESSSISDIEFLIFKDNINNDDKLNIILTEKQLKEKRLKHGKINVVGLLIQNNRIWNTFQYYLFISILYSIFIL